VPGGVTLNVYAHLWPDADDRACRAVEAVFALDSGRIVPSGPCGRGRVTCALVSRP
jgi:hypothetical protein